MTSKTFEGYLVVNWKTGHMKVTKKKPKRDNQFHIPIKFSINVNMPEYKEIEAKGEITIPETQAEMIIEDAI